MLSTVCLYCYNKSIVLVYTVFLEQYTVVVALPRDSVRLSAGYRSCMQLIYKTSYTVLDTNLHAWAMPVEAHFQA